MRYAALLRGINVGGNKKIPMAALRELMQGLGYADVVTHLQSGNAVFSSAKQPQTLARASCRFRICPGDRIAGRSRAHGPHLYRPAAC